MIRDHLPDQKGPGLIQSGLIRLTLLRLCMRRLGCRIGPDRSNQAIWKFPTYAQHMARAGLTGAVASTVHYLIPLKIWYSSLLQRNIQVEVP